MDGKAIYEVAIFKCALIVSQTPVCFSFMDDKQTIQWLLAYCYIFGNGNHLASKLANLVLTKN